MYKILWTHREERIDLGASEKTIRIKKADFWNRPERWAWHFPHGVLGRIPLSVNNPAPFWMFITTASSLPYEAHFILNSYNCCNVLSPLSPMVPFTISAHWFQFSPLEPMGREALVFLPCKVIFIFENRYHVHFQVVTFPHWKREMDKVSSLVPWEGDLRWSWCIGGLGVNALSPTRPEWKGRSRQREKYSVRQYFLSLFLTVLGLCWCAQAFSSYCEQGLHSSCGVPATHCGDFSCGRAWAPGLTGFTNCGALASRPAAYRIFLAQE